MTDKPLRILFSAVSGYGYYYLKTFWEEVAPAKAFVCGIIDPQPGKSDHFGRIMAENIPVFGDIDSFFAAGHNADLTVIASPLQFHVSQAIAAMENGSDVLVDKPVGVTVQEVERLISVRSKTGRHVEVGYQWSFSDPVRQLKQDILDGKFGRLLRMKSICLWPRPFSYFNRNNWAGRISDDHGALVLDSIANNACAHFLHNMFFLSGPAMNLSSKPVTVSGRRRRAYPIQNFDTVECHALTDTGVEIGFYASHVTENQVNPAFQFEFENAVVTLDVTDSGIVATMSDGHQIGYGHPDSSPQFRKLHISIDRCLNPGPPICPPEAALSQTICINALHALPNPIETYPSTHIITEPDRLWVKGLTENLLTSYNSLTPSLPHSLTPSLPNSLTPSQ